MASHRRRSGLEWTVNSRILDGERICSRLNLGCSIFAGLARLAGCDVLSCRQVTRRDTEGIEAHDTLGGLRSCSPQGLCKSRHPVSESSLTVSGLSLIHI